MKKLFLFLFFIFLNFNIIMGQVPIFDTTFLLGKSGDISKIEKSQNNENSFIVGGYLLAMNNRFSPFIAEIDSTFKFKWMIIDNDSIDHSFKNFIQKNGKIFFHTTSNKVIIIEDGIKIMEKFVPENLYLGLKNNKIIGIPVGNYKPLKIYFISDNLTIEDSITINNFITTADRAVITEINNTNDIIVGTVDYLTVSIARISLTDSSAKWIYQIYNASRVHLNIDGDNLIVGSDNFDNNMQKFVLMKLNISSGLPIVSYQWFPNQRIYNNFWKTKIIGNYVSSIGNIVVENSKQKAYLSFFTKDYFSLISEIIYSYQFSGETITTAYDIIESNGKVIVVGKIIIGWSNSYSYCYIRVYNLNDLILETEKSPNTLSYNLYQNYPNPFNSSTTIRFTLPEIAKVTLKVYNILGQEVAVILENKELPAGDYEYCFDLDASNSGVYIYIMDAGNFIQTKKMVLIK